jgi:type IV pilus assembly protein PilB
VRSVHAEREARPSRLIGEVIVDLGFADLQTVEAAVETAATRGITTGQVLIEQGSLTGSQLAQAVAERFDIDFVDLTKYEVELGAFNLLDSALAKHYDATPISFDPDGTLIVAMADPNNLLTADDLSMIMGLRIRPVAASREDIRMLVSGLAQSADPLEGLVVDDGDVADAVLEQPASPDDAPIVKLVRSIIAQAIERGASDIHFDPEPTQMRVLFRIDGLLAPSTTRIRRAMAPAVISRLKIMAELDISERRVPQDGRMVVTVDGRRVDIRAVALPLVGGETVVLRILDHGTEVRDLDGLGLLPEENGRLSNALSQRQGAVLVTGPTGSGKSTTLYAALNILNRGDRSILTIEDPVEAQIAGVKQMQIAPKAGMTFANGLRSMLRADPDVIMVGEIRDKETARIAVEAALTGHLMLSTLHTRSAPAALSRLRDMGIEPFLIAAAIDCVVAQRLARLLCVHCKRQSNLPESVLQEQGLDGIQPYEAVGCERCSGTGYRGRTGLYEVMVITDEIRTVLLETGSVVEIAAIAAAQGMRTIREGGIEKIKSGDTSIAEVGRVVGVA